MMTLRKAEDRGHADHGWLNTYHTFSFANYYDPKHMGFHGLRVINEDRVQPNQGFGTHGHENMEIISYVLEGALEHKDSMGNGTVIRPDDVQRMSAGTGVRHSEFNPSSKEQVHFLQIWLLPMQGGIKPSYEQKTIARAQKEGRLQLIASPGGTGGSVTIHADAYVYSGLFERERVGELLIAEGRHAWVHIARGKARINGQDLEAGDGVGFSDTATIKIEGIDASEVLVFDLA